MKKIILPFCFLLLLSGTATAQALDADKKAKLDSLFTAISENDKGMGSIALSKNGEIIYTRSTGFSSIQGVKRVANDEHTIYHIGSISKMFTSVMIFQLIEEGKLSLTTPIGNYFPELPNASKITISNLLNHRSGLHNFTNDSTYTSWMEEPHTQQEMLKIISSSPVDFEPDATADYSNANYVVLGYVVEKITGKKYQEALKARILSKAGLTHTYYAGRIDPSRKEAQSFQFMGGWLPSSETDMSVPHGAGAIVSTPVELIKFEEALFAHKLINEKSLAQMTTMKDDYGMGIFQIPFGRKISYGHTGGIDGFSSVLGYFPKDSFAFSYCSNGENYPTNDILIGVLSIYFGVPYNIPTFKALALKAEDLDKYVGVYSSSQMPLKITVSKNGTTLMAQATGQSAFPLEASAPDVFKFDPADITMTFRPAKNEFTMSQSGMSYVFTKDK